MLLVEEANIQSGLVLLKYWLEVSTEEHTRRLKRRIDDGRRIWKLTARDLKSCSRWPDYSRARNDMLLATKRLLALRGAGPETRDPDLARRACARSESPARGRSSPAPTDSCCASTRIEYVLGHEMDDLLAPTHNAPFGA
jgi:hypothetical protein